MFTLTPQKIAFFRVKRGQCADEIEKFFSSPVCGEVFAGQIISLSKIALFEYSPEPLETYSSIAKKFGVTEEELKKINSEKPVFPTCRIFIPQKGG